jgi:hypothetical protein
MSGDGVLAPNGLIVSVAAYPTTGDDGTERRPLGCEAVAKWMEFRDWQLAADPYDGK